MSSWRCRSVSKKTILFVSHDLDEALKLGDRISMLEGGRIVQTGTAEDIVLRPGNAYVAEFVQHMNPLNVLTGAMIMRGASELARENDSIWLDDARRYRVSVNARASPRGSCATAQRSPSAGSRKGRGRKSWSALRSRQRRCRCARSSSCASARASGAARR